MVIKLQVGKASTEIPPIFVFGDSTTDVGTNNYLPVERARADFPFNGIDYRDAKPTGRFSNGHNIADTIARLFGHKRSPPPFVALLRNQPFFKRNVLWGANFASGGAGLLDFTGRQLKVITIREQVEQFGTVCNNITQVMGESAEKVISNSLIIISIGSNGIFDYLLYNDTHNVEYFITTVMQSYHYHLTNLLNPGARKFGIVSVSPIGCIPRYRVQNPTGECIEERNLYAQKFSIELEGIMQKLSAEFEGMKYSLGNSYEVTSYIIDNHLAYGFKDAITACCGLGKIGAESPCLPNVTVCQNRDDFFWWDRYHPSQASCEVLALTLYRGSQKYVKPISFSQLVEDI
ncbi:hypothetical protein P3X46_029114 [Hevea brasiliensis]|uniref:Uncharacterized protein n=1 Tax=Hevea brasiliensis TaxID=3981 RepID=A0ABQ9KT41_HEVBR|nr:hypothetical protein P3X46_029114 [Hevea brasiliensis]